MPHLTDMIAKLQAQLDMLKEVHRDETAAMRDVSKAHKAEGKKVHGKRMGAKAKEALKKLHAHEGDAIAHLSETHDDETQLIRSVAKDQRKVNAAALKGAPAHVMKSAEVKPETAAAKAADEPVKRGRGRPRKTPAPTVSAEAPAKAAEAPAPKPEHVAPRLKLTEIVEPGMMRAELSGKAPETGPQEVAKAVEPKAEKKAEKKPKAEKKEYDSIDFFNVFNSLINENDVHIEDLRNDVVKLLKEDIELGEGGYGLFKKMPGKKTIAHLVEKVIKAKKELVPELRLSSKAEKKPKAEKKKEVVIKSPEMPAQKAIGEKDKARFKRMVSEGKVKKEDIVEMKSKGGRSAVIAEFLESLM